MATFEKDCCVRGYHVYQRVWDAAIGETLTCRREPTNKSVLSNVHNNNACLINFTIYLFSYVKFLWNQLTSKIYYHRKSPDLQYIV